MSLLIWRQPSTYLQLNYSLTAIFTIYQHLHKSPMFIYSTFQTYRLSLQANDQIFYSKYIKIVADFHNRPNTLQQWLKYQNMPLKTSSVGVAVVLHHGGSRDPFPERRYALDWLYIDVNMAWQPQPREILTLPHSLKPSILALWELLECSHVLYGL